MDRRTKRAHTCTSTKGKVSERESEEEYIKYIKKRDVVMNLAVHFDAHIHANGISWTAAFRWVRYEKQLVDIECIPKCAIQMNRLYSGYMSPLQFLFVRSKYIIRIDASACKMATWINHTVPPKIADAWNLHLEIRKCCAWGGAQRVAMLFCANTAIYID